jgi:hypothetical protein
MMSFIVKVIFVLCLLIGGEFVIKNLYGIWKEKYERKKQRYKDF